MFSGAEHVVRAADRQRERYEVAILDVSRVDDIDDAARELLSAMGSTLRVEGKAFYLVDPDGIVIRSEPELEVIRFHTVDDAVEQAQVWLDQNRRVSLD